MLSAFHSIITILFWLSLISLFLGLFKPVLVLWFLDRFNRLKVIQIYGTLSLLLALLYLLIDWLK
ncbi:hypothetical protein EF405_17535 [Cyclobacteriaceae bacterium YHN15]|nr:hypothetical protein EF405_17535 [Cyclobacteriaceae bacterium YHN15]